DSPMPSCNTSLSPDFITLPLKVFVSGNWPRVPGCCCSCCSTKGAARLPSCCALAAGAQIKANTSSARPPSGRNTFVFFITHLQELLKSWQTGCQNYGRRRMSLVLKFSGTFFAYAPCNFGLLQKNSSPCLQFPRLC